MPQSVFALKSISGRTVLCPPRAGSFPTDASDFEFARLTLSESDDAKMIWWLFMAYFHRYEMLPFGTRSEVVLAALLLANHLRHNGWGGPTYNQRWPLHRRHCTEIAYARLCDIDKASTLSAIEHAPNSHEWADAEAAVRHTNLMSRLSPMMQKLSDESSFNARRAAFQHPENDSAHFCTPAQQQDQQNDFDNLHVADAPMQSARALPSITASAASPKRAKSLRNLFFFRRTPSGGPLGLGGQG